jgi:hypothetical protein
MRRFVLLPVPLVVGLLSAAVSPRAEAAPVAIAAPPGVSAFDNTLLRDIYYYHGQNYPYRYKGHYYHHRRYRDGRWYYY